MKLKDDGISANKLTTPSPRAIAFEATPLIKPPALRRVPDSPTSLVTVGIAN